MYTARTFQMFDDNDVVLADDRDTRRCRWYSCRTNRVPVYRTPVSYSHLSCSSRVLSFLLPLPLQMEHLPALSHRDSFGLGTFHTRLNFVISTRRNALVPVRDSTIPVQARRDERMTNGIAYGQPRSTGSSISIQRHGPSFASCRYRR